MKKLLGLVVAVLLLAGCQEKGTKAKDYFMYQVGFTPSKGSVKVTDLGDGRMEVSIKLNPTYPGAYQAHLHFGDINEVGELAYRLTDLDGTTGVSKTILDNVELADGSILTYDQLLEMDGSIKVHLNSDGQKSAVLAYGNIGKNDNYLSSGITVCSGH